LPIFAIGMTENDIRGGKVRASMNGKKFAQQTLTAIAELK